MNSAIKKSIPSDVGMATTTKLQELPNGAIITTVPKDLAGALGWGKGTTIQWKLEGGRLYVELTK